METSAHRVEAFQFNGSGGEYFRIWIVNMLLSILTLGIYSAWAKVRKHRYFYGNTQVAGASFDYTADPRAILKGRMIAFGLFALYSASEQVFPPAQIVLSLMFLVALPWIVTRSLAFRARNTVWRNMRFNFDAGYKDAVMAYAGWPVIGVLTLGLAMPYAMYQQKKLSVDRTLFGSRRFEFAAPAREFYFIYLAAMLIFMNVGVYFIILSRELPAGVTGPLLFAVLPLFYVVAVAYFVSAMANTVYNNSHLGPHQFVSSLSTKDMFMLYLTNTLGIMLTLGLFIPWAQVRLARYRASQLVLMAGSGLDEFMAGEQGKAGTAGEEIGEMFDIDVGI